MKITFKTVQSAFVPSVGNILRLSGAICLAVFALCTALSSCSSDSDEPDGPESAEQNNDGRKLRQLTIADVPITRATLTDNGTTLGAAWKGGDKATYFNLSTFTGSDLDFGLLTASSSAATSTFTGTVRCTKDDYLALFYPETTPILTGGNRGKFTISLSGQKGTIEDVATNFHYVYGVGQVTSVTETTATATISEMNSLLAVCKFIFKDSSNNPIPVNTLSINYDDTGYPLTGTLAPIREVPNPTVDVVDPSEWSEPLTITLQTETSDGVYVALFPVSKYNFFISATGSNGTYTGNAAATLNAGKFYPVTLKLTKQ